MIKWYRKPINPQREHQIVITTCKSNAKCFTRSKSEVPRIVEVEKVVEVPQIHRRVVQKPVEKIEEEIIEIPHIEFLSSI